MIYKTLIMGLGAVLLSACGVVDSESVSTHRMYMDITVSGENNRTTVSTELHDDGAKFDKKSILLTGGDRLLAEVDGDPIQMEYTVANFIGAYRGVAHSAREGALLKVSLMRPNYEDVFGTVVLPQSLMLTSPSAGEVFTTEDTISFSWNPGAVGDSIYVKVFLECDKPNIANRHEFFHSRTVPDTGIHTMPVALIVKAREWQTASELDEFGNIVEHDPDAQRSIASQLPEPGSLCNTSISLQRRTTGSLVGPIKGNVYASQYARTSLVLAYK